MAEVIPFRIDIPEAELADLRRRLRQTRWPEREPVADWSQGVPLDYLRELCDYWADGYDWRATEARLNALPQFRTVIDGLAVHFVHVRSPRPDALPLIITHGWPGSVVEFGKVIGPLSDPDDAADAFHVVCPSLPGYGFSGKPDSAGWGIERIAAAWASLMARLGYQRYGAVGSDWGTSVSTLLGLQDPEHVAGIHLIPPLAGPDPATFGDLTDAERAALDALRHSAERDSGYSTEHATRPQTIGYALTDSPAALAAWIVEKFWSWTDHDGSLDDVLPAGQPDAVLAARHRRVVGPALLGEHPPGERVDRRFSRGHGGRADGLFGLPGRAAAAVTAVGPEAVHRHPVLERACPRRSLRRVRAAIALYRRGAGVLPAGPLATLANLASRG
jgi:pimeloyl-ACP methyl ester carboxylesterase